MFGRDSQGSAQVCLMISFCENILQVFFFLWDLQKSKNSIHLNVFKCHKPIYNSFSFCRFTHLSFHTQKSITPFFKLVVTLPTWKNWPTSFFKTHSMTHGHSFCTLAFMILIGVDTPTLNMVSWNLVLCFSCSIDQVFKYFLFFYLQKNLNSTVHLHHTI